MNDSVRQRAYEEALEKLKNHRSSKVDLTPEQLEYLATTEDPFEIGHAASQKLLEKQNERKS
jgi:hypothetical protein